MLLPGDSSRIVGVSSGIAFYAIFSSGRGRYVRATYENVLQTLERLDTCLNDALGVVDSARISFQPEQDCPGRRGTVYTDHVRIQATEYGRRLTMVTSGTPDLRGDRCAHG